MLGYLLNELDWNNAIFPLRQTIPHPVRWGITAGMASPPLLPAAMSGGIRWIWPGERYFMEGALEGLTANDIFRLQMNYMGFMEKVGS